MKCPACQHEFQPLRQSSPQWPIWVKRADSRARAETAEQIAADSPCDRNGGTYTAEEVEAALLDESRTERRFSSYVGDDGKRRWWAEPF